MPKTKTPFFSLGSRGSIADALTSQKRGSQTLLRAKPQPAYRFTLPQAYQRWLYQDYIAYWHQQSLDTQLAYASLGVPHHLTGFQYWMKYHLTNLPDIAAWWKLDDNRGATTIDSSRNSNTAIIIGASPATGPIGPCLSFDGLNDLCSIPDHPSLDHTTALTLEALINPSMNPLDTTAYIYTKHVDRHSLYILADRSVHAWITGLVGGALLSFNYIAPIDTTTHLTFTYDMYAGANNYRTYVNGTLTNSGTRTGPIPTSALPLYLAAQHTGFFFPGLIDNVIDYNRALHPTCIQRHSLRRYPLQ